MQTFLPYPSYKRSAECLDTKRLGKQRIEAVQILSTLLGFSDGWRNHPAVRMWVGHEGALFEYANAVCAEWTSRGFSNKETGVKLTNLGRLSAARLKSTMAVPAWLGDEEFHASHRSNLLRKDAERYGRCGWKEPDDLPYVWPASFVKAVRSEPVVAGAQGATKPARKAVKR
jgi:hypothetical protein